MPGSRSVSNYYNLLQYKLTLHRDCTSLRWNIEVSRRHFLKLAGAGAAGSAIAALGFGEAEAFVASHVRPFKLASAAETRNTYPYCPVACGVIMYSRGDLRKGERADIFHIEGDSDHPTNRGTLCPKGAALLDFVKAPTRTLHPQIRRPGSTAFEPVTWDQALNHIARRMPRGNRRWSSG